MKKIVLLLAVFLVLALLGQILLNMSQENKLVAVEEETVVGPDEVPATTTAEAVQLVPPEDSIAEPIEALVETPILVKPECVIIEDFTNGASQLQWFAVNDGVMGGLSAGAVSVTEEALVHTGTINTNGGGFSSVRARLPDDILVGYTQLQIRLNTFGRQYAVNFGDNRYRSVSHRAALPASPGDTWQEVSVDFDQTVPTRIGFRVDAEPFASSAINEISLILADGADGPFRMEVEWIKACL